MKLPGIPPTASRPFRTVSPEREKGVVMSHALNLDRRVNGYQPPFGTIFSLGRAGPR